ncbi:unnamed protein product [Mycena citricolor]|uniref:Uncharacterized protein n=1 Tax=Mycena citricolor TaxID=2018698 RepID=A0AAD2HP40_9AGAR|nr:unnamed protein product [Mycena citricolor]
MLSFSFLQSWHKALACTTTVPDWVLKQARFRNGVDLWELLMTNCSQVGRLAFVCSLSVFIPTQAIATGRRPTGSLHFVHCVLLKDLKLSEVEDGIPQSPCTSLEIVSHSWVISGCRQCIDISARVLRQHLCLSHQNIQRFSRLTDAAPHPPSQTTLSRPFVRQLKPSQIVLSSMIMPQLRSGHSRNGVATRIPNSTFELSWPGQDEVSILVKKMQTLTTKSSRSSELNRLHHKEQLEQHDVEEIRQEEPDCWAVATRLMSFADGELPQDVEQSLV